MIKNTLTTFLRQFRRKPADQFLTIFSLSVGLCTVFLSSLWINYHKSFNQMHSDAALIYEVKTNSVSNDGAIQTYGGAVYEVLADARKTLPAIDEVIRIISTWRWPSEQCLKVDESKDCLYRKGIYTDSSFFKVFDFNILTGSKNPLKEPRSIAFSSSVAKKLFGDENPVGKKYLMGDYYEVTITAVYEDVPATSSLQFEFVAPLDVVYGLWGIDTERMKNRSFHTYVKLNAPNPEKVAAQLASLPVAQNYENDSYLLHPLLDQHLYTEFEHGKKAGGLIDYLNMIGLFSFFIFLMSMVNFINITTAQATSRGKEIGVRKVSGASRLALQGQFLLETFLKVLIAIGFALLLTYLLLPVLSDIIDQEIPLTINNETLVKLLLVAILTPFLVGLYPALLMSRFNPIQIIKNTSLKELGKGVVRKWLTVLQVGVSCIIITMACVFYLQLDYLQNKSLGYDPEGILMMEPTFKHVMAFESFKEQLLQHHQIKALGLSNANMIDATNSTDQVYWPGQNTDEKTLFKIIGVDNGLLEVFQLGILQGQNFNPTDTSKQVILSESALQKMGLKEPIGQQVKLGNEAYKVAGIVSDINSQSLHTDMIPTIFFDVEPRYSGMFYFRYDKSQPIAAIEAIEQVYDEFEPFSTIKYKMLNEEYQKAYSEEKVISSLSGMVMVIALFIALGGILGLLSFNLNKRYREIGLRKIFGANDFQAFKMISSEFFMLLLVANGVGGGISILLMQEWLSGFAYRIATPLYLIPLNLCAGLAITLLLLVIKSRRVLEQNTVEVIRTE